MGLLSSRDPRSFPVWVARTLNLIPGFGWTNKYCSGGCGYPTTGEHVMELDVIEEVPVKVITCGDPECDRSVIEDPRDAAGTHYADIRPSLVEAIHASRIAGHTPTDMTLSFGR